MGQRIPTVVVNGVAQRNSLTSAFFVVRKAFLTTEVTKVTEAKRTVKSLDGRGADTQAIDHTETASPRGRFVKGRVSWASAFRPWSSLASRSETP
ncbi:MAG TPA: hypothetical protein PLI18_01365 [Pirellulaceae bacterium]|nr:hypothetical protein [Pirellulaceae bacterium]